MERLRTIRGDAPRFFKIREFNDSGRADLDWKRGESYLLFTSFSKQTHAWTVPGCDNSVPLSQAGPALQRLAALAKDDPDPVLSGLVSTDSWSTGLPGVQILAIGTASTYQARTDDSSHFQLQLPPGTYTVRAQRPGWSFQLGIFSYENPRHLTMTPGSCAQVHLEGIPNHYERPKAR